MKSSLNPLQHRVLELLKDMQPKWSLTGGGALAGFHTGHRETEDLDLFFPGQSALTHQARDVEYLLSEAAISVRRLQTSPAFQRLAAQDGIHTVRIDLVADAVPRVEDPENFGGVLVDSQHEILVNKLCALLSRTEPRDLEDVRVLLDHGGDLQRAIADAPRKDAGFSPPTLAWVLQSFPLAQSTKLGFDADALERTRDTLIATLSPAKD